MVGIEYLLASVSDRLYNNFQEERSYIYYSKQRTGKYVPECVPMTDEEFYLHSARTQGLANPFATCKKRFRNTKN